MTKQDNPNYKKVMARAREIADNNEMVAEDVLLAYQRIVVEEKRPIITELEDLLWKCTNHLAIGRYFGEFVYGDCTGPYDEKRGYENKHDTQWCRDRIMLNADTPEMGCAVLLGRMDEYRGYMLSVDVERVFESNEAILCLAILLHECDIVYDGNDYDDIESRGASVVYRGEVPPNVMGRQFYQQVRLFVEVLNAFDLMSSPLACTDLDCGIDILKAFSLDTANFTLAPEISTAYDALPYWADTAMESIRFKEDSNTAETRRFLKYMDDALKIWGATRKTSSLGIVFNERDINGAHIHEQARELAEALGIADEIRALSEGVPYEDIVI